MITKHTPLHIISALVLFFSFHLVLAAIPTTLNYQGHLTDSSSVPVDGIVSMTFAIYDVESGGTSLWAESIPVTANQGVFSVELGAGASPFPPGLFENSLWIGLAIATDTEMSPRRPVSSVGFSFKAGDADTLEGVRVSTLDQSAHVTDTANPHSVYPVQIGAITSNDFDKHTSDSENPHNVNTDQTGAATNADFTSHTASSVSHHSRYTSTEAVNAMGAMSDVNALNHDKYTDANVVTAMLNNDGAGSSFDADLVDGLQASEIIDAGRVNPVQNKITVAKSGGDYLTIQAAINAVTPGATNPYIIEVAPGTYKESIVMKSYIHLQGSGPDQSIIIPDSAGASTEQGFTAIWLNNLQGVRISGFTLYGGESGVEDIGAIGIRDISSSPVVENMRITGFVHTGVTAISRAGIYSTKSSPHIYHNEINTNERYGVLLDSADSAKIIGNTFLDNIGNQTGPHCAVTINESSALISNNYFRGNDAPVCVTGSPLDGEDDVLISSNYLIENYDGIRVNGDVRANIIGNYIETSFTIGIGIRGGDANNATQIIGNTIYGTECGIVADGPSAIIGNYVFNAQIGCESIIYGGNSNGSYHRADTVFGNYAAHGYGGTGPHPGFSLVTDGYKISSQDPDGISPGKDIILMVGGTQVIIGQDGNVSIVAEGDLMLQGTNVSITATNDMSIYAGNALSVDSGSTTAITVGSDLGIITANNTSITVGNTVSVESGASTQISAGSEVDITGGTVVDINGGQIHLN